MPKPSPDGLIAHLKGKSDLAILQEQGWYRVPVWSIAPEAARAALLIPKTQPATTDLSLQPILSEGIVKDKN